MPDNEQQIRERAYAIWESEGRPHGRDADHWRQASEELAAASAAHKVSGNGLASGLQPGGTLPGASPATGMGSIGTGGGSTANRPTGSKAAGE
jgi:hypothetical protein